MKSYRAMCKGISEIMRPHNQIWTMFILSMVIMLLLLWGLQTESTVQAAEKDVRDTDITRAIERDLFISDEVSSHLIDVETNSGVVTLSGTVDNLFAKEYAVKIAESIKGVWSIVNRITVRPVLRKDSDIAKDVRDAFLLSPVTEAGKIGIDVREGTVTLTGKVDSTAERWHAATIAKGIRGVKKIEDNIVVDFKGKQKRPDAEFDAMASIGHSW